MDLVKTHHWRGLNLVAPHPLRKLIDLCASYSRLSSYTDLEMAKYSKNLQYNITGVDIARIQIIAGRIISEYKKIIELSNIKIEKKDRETLDQDIQKQLYQWFDSQGKLLNPIKDVQDALRFETLHFFLPFFKTPVEWFIKSRIYDCYLEARSITEDTFRDKIKALSTKEEEETFIEKYEPPYDWIGLMRRIPDKETKIMCELCMNYEIFMDGVYQRLPSFPKTDVTRIKKQQETIMNLYIGITEDINTIKNLKNFNHFINHIYNKVTETLKTTDEIEVDDFVTFTVHKADIFPTERKDERTITIPSQQSHFRQPRSAGREEQWFTG